MKNEKLQKIIKLSSITVLTSLSLNSCASSGQLYAVEKKQKEQNEKITSLEEKVQSIQDIKINNGKWFSVVFKNNFQIVFLVGAYGHTPLQGKHTSLHHNTSLQKIKRRIVPKRIIQFID